MPLLEILELFFHDDIDMVYEDVFWQKLKKNWFVKSNFSNNCLSYLYLTVV